MLEERDFSLKHENYEVIINGASRTFGEENKNELLKN